MIFNSIFRSVTACDPDKMNEMRVNKDKILD